MKSKYQIELANNGMVIRRSDIGEVVCFEYKEGNSEGIYEPIAKWIGEDILGDMLDSPQILDEVKKLMEQTGSEGINDFEIAVEIKPISK